MVRQYGRAAKKNLREGAKKMEEVMTPAARVLRRIKAGRPRLSVPNVLEAIHLGRSAANALYESMKTEGLHIKDADCLLVCATPEEKVILRPYAFEYQDSSDLEIARDLLRDKLAAIGIAFRIIDREKNNELQHVRLFEPSQPRDGLARVELLRWAAENNND